MMAINLSKEFYKENKTVEITPVHLISEEESISSNIKTPKKDDTIKPATIETTRKQTSIHIHKEEASLEKSDRKVEKQSILPFGMLADLPFSVITATSITGMLLVVFREDIGNLISALMTTLLSTTETTTSISATLFTDVSTYLGMVLVLSSGLGCMIKLLRLHRWF